MATLSGALLVGCAGEDERNERELAETGEIGSICVKDAQPAKLPPEFPRDLPVPPDAVIVSSETRSENRLIVNTVVPGGFRPTLEFLQREFSAKGYELTEGEVEKRDAESNFTGHGVRGRWAIREVPDCPDDVTLTYLTQPQN